MLGIISKNTILKAIHNITFDLNSTLKLGIISKNTILKAIHNLFLSLYFARYVGNHK